LHNLQDANALGTGREVRLEASADVFDEKITRALDRTQ
jgi:hypothetical protein